MKQFTRKLMAGLMAAAMLLTASVTSASAAGLESTVEFRGRAEKFVFNGDASGSNKDLFANFKNLMPGQSAEQTVTFKNTGSYQMQMYFRIEAPTLADFGGDAQALAESQKLANALQIKLTYNGVELPVKTLGDTLNTYYLGRYSRYSPEGTFKVELIVPAELGNDYQDLMGKIKWVFIAVDDDDDDDDDDPGYTVDDPDLPLGGGDDIIIVDPNLPLGNLPQTGGGCEKQ